MQTNSRLALQLVAGIAVALGVGYIVSNMGPAKMGVQTRNLSNAKQIATGCKLYAVDHHGRFPMHVSELEPDYLVNLKSLRCLSMGPNDDAQRIQMDWLYFGAGFDDDHPPTVLIASPQATTVGKQHKRIVIEGDTAGYVMDEEKYLPILAETVGQMRALDDAQHPAKPTAPGTTSKDAPPNQ